MLNLTELGNIKYQVEHSKLTALDLTHKLLRSENLLLDFVNFLFRLVLQVEVQCLDLFVYLNVVTQKQHLF
jgi:hypothetical protein